MKIVSISNIDDEDVITSLSFAVDDEKADEIRGLLGKSFAEAIGDINKVAESIRGLATVVEE